MSVIIVPPKRHEIPEEYTWNLASIFATDADWEAEFAQVSALLPAIRAYQGRLAESGADAARSVEHARRGVRALGPALRLRHMRMHEDTANSTYQALADRATTLGNELNTASAYHDAGDPGHPAGALDGFLAEEPKLARLPPRAG